MKNRFKNILYVFSLIIFLEPQLFKENSFNGVTYVDMVYKVLKIILFLFILYLYLSKRKISLIVILSSILELVLGVSTLINKGSIIRFSGPAITVVAMAMLAELMYKDENFISNLKKVNIYLRITFVINIISLVLIDYTNFNTITKVYFWGIDNRFVFTMIPWIFFEGIVAIKEKQELDVKWLTIVVICEAILCLKKSVAAMLMIPLFIIAYLVQKKNVNRFKDSIIILTTYIASNFAILFTNILKVLAPITRLLGKDPTLSGRTFIWNGVIKKANSNLLIGGGTQSINVDKEYFYNSSAPHYYPWCRVQHAHNSLMNLLYRGGFLSISIYLIIIMYVTLNANKIKNNSIKALSIITLGIILYLSIFDTIDFACLYYIFSIIICISSFKIENKYTILIQKAVKSIRRYILVYFFNLFPIEKNSIFVSNYNGKGYGDSAKPIIEELNKKNNKYRIYWLVENIKDIKPNDFPKNIIPVQKDSLNYFFHICTSSVWLDNRRPIIELNKRKKQFYIQLWHGGIALKKIEKDAEKSLKKRYVRAAKKDSKKINIMISNSKFCTKLYKTSFWYNGVIKEYGLPRNDILINKENHTNITDKVKKHFNIDKNEKILLYAPTFRKDLSIKAYNVDFKKLEQILEKKYKTKWRILVKLHPNIDEQKANQLLVTKKMINASKYSDMQELMIASDILISDYSSVMFEFSFMDKPVFLYANDINDYVDDRGFYFDLNNLPYKLSTNNEELFNAINQFNKDDYLKVLHSFFNQIGLKESGQASKKIVEDIERVMENG